MSKRLLEVVQVEVDLPDEVWLQIFEAGSSHAWCRVTLRFNRLIFARPINPDLLRPLASKSNIDFTLQPYNSLARLPPQLMTVAACQFARLSGTVKFEFLHRVRIFIRTSNFLTNSQSSRKECLRRTKLVVMGDDIVQVWPYPLYRHCLKRPYSDTRPVIATTRLDDVRDLMNARLKVCSLAEYRLPPSAKVVIRDTEYRGNFANAVFVPSHGDVEFFAKKITKLRLCRETNSHFKQLLLDYLAGVATAV